MVSRTGGAMAGAPLGLLIDKGDWTTALHVMAACAVLGAGAVLPMCFKAEAKAKVE